MTSAVCCKSWVLIAAAQNPVKVEVASHNHQTADNLRQQYLFVPAKHKDCYLAYVLTEMAGSTAMLFTRTCDATRRVALTLVRWCARV